jgi:hypothetical protein
MNIWVVSFMVSTGGRGLDEPLVFVFDDHEQAIEFQDHIRDLYEIPNVNVMESTIDTYDTAIQAVVEAIGPSDE